MDIIDALKPFQGLSYDEHSLINFLEERKYSDFKISHLENGDIRIYMNLYEEERTLFVGLDEDKKIKTFTFLNGKIEQLMSNGSTIGCLVGVVIVIGLVIWFGSMVISAIMEDDYDFDDDDDYDTFDPGRGANFDHNQDGELDNEEFGDWYEYKTTHDDDGDF